MQRLIKDQENRVSTDGENQAFAQVSVLSNKTLVRHTFKKKEHMLYPEDRA